MKNFTPKDFWMLKQDDEFTQYIWETFISDEDGNPIQGATLKFKWVPGSYKYQVEGRTAVIINGNEIGTVRKCESCGNMVLCLYDRIEGEICSLCGFEQEDL